MTELIIDGVRAVLANNFAVTVKQENPFITKNGEYTYDCTLSLLNAVNANLYSFLQRINKREPFATDRRVILIADNRVYCDGSEVVTKWTDKEVTIQIVSGNSQLNYFIGSDKKISELQLGEFTNDDSAHSAALYDFISMGYAFPTVKVADELVNGYDYTTDNDASHLYFTYTPKTTCKWIPMPYFTTIIEKVLEALGYSVKKNVIRDTDYKNMILVHSVVTNKLNEMLPEWTVKEFLEEIEKFFNVVFYINYKTKDVEILTQQKFYATASMIHIKNVKDAYESEIDENAYKDEHTTANIGYSLGSSNYYKFTRLDDDVIAKATAKSLSYEEISRYFNDTVTDPDAENMVLDTDPNDGRQYIRALMKRDLVNGIKGEVSTENVHGAYEVNQYKNLIRKKDDTSIGIELAIIPVEITREYNQSISNIYNSDGSLSSDKNEKDIAYNVGVISNDESEEESTEKTMYDYINNFASKNTSKSTLYCGFYAGRVYFSNLEINGRGKGVSMPQLYMDVCETVAKDMSIVSHSESFRLSVVENEFYDTPYTIDRTKKITVESYDENVYDPRQIFEIKNKRFVCEYIEYSIDSKGRKGAWKGIFHPVDISDTDAEHLWILADGRWRDNGVYIDNGRWLDN